MPLYLLEVDWLTDALYGGDREHRIRQELLLGVGGVRALTALGIEPTVFHLNEGHSAFLQIERTRALVEQGMETAARSSRCVPRRSSPRTPRCRRGTRSSTKSSSYRYVGPLAAEAGLDREALLDLGRFGDKPGFGTDAARAASVRVRERRLRAARRGRARDVDAALARPGDADRPRHERRPLGTWLDPSLTELLRAAGVSRRRRRTRRTGTRETDRLRGALAGPRRGESTARRASRDRPRDGSRSASPVASRPTSAPASSSPTSSACSRCRPVRRRRQGSPGRRPGKDVMQAIVELARDPRLTVASSSSRTTTWARPHDRARLRRLAEHAARPLEARARAA